MQGVGEPVPKELLEAEVLDADGEAVRFGTVIAGTAAVVVFLRHFACAACAEHVTLLAPRLHEFTRLGVKVVYVGNGAANFIEGFVERNHIDLSKVTVVTDPSLATHAAAGMHRSAMSVFGPRGLMGWMRARFVGGFRQTGLEGDHAQQGGVLVIDAEGRLCYAHQDQVLGEHAPMGAVIEAAMRVATADADVV